MLEFESIRISENEFLEGVQSSLHGAHCISAWLGVGNALYLGFDLPGGWSPANRTRGILARELSSFFCNWELRDESQLIFSDEHDRDVLIGPISNLISQSVTDISISTADYALELRLSGGYLLKLRPWTLDQSGDHKGITDAWVMQDGEQYYSVSCDHTLTRGRYVQRRSP